MLPGRNLNPDGEEARLPLPGHCVCEGWLSRGLSLGCEADHPSIWAKRHLLRAGKLHAVVVLRALQ